MSQLVIRGPGPSCGEHSPGPVPLGLMGGADPWMEPPTQGSAGVRWPYSDLVSGGPGEWGGCPPALSLGTSEGRAVVRTQAGRWTDVLGLSLGSALSL